ncbi:F-box/kelch-repeat protein At3g06240-like [Silene latifolia]|uniref:F-box/kelch-repeat protein At3g06240-like n=1 Tax=Silene latifolia TaxID=37657 RepID=UPI003D77137C
MTNTISMNNPRQLNQERNIPVDLLETEILPRLPIESLLRFKVVSKQWLAIISNPQFTKLDLHRSMSSQHSTLLVLNFDNSVSFLNHADQCSTSHDLVVDRKLNPNQDLIISPGSKIDLIDSCNGLICLAIGLEKLCFFNPATRVCREVFCPEAIDLFDDPCLWAFGYSTMNDEYKLLYVDGIISDKVRKAHVYTLRNNDNDLRNWKELSVDLRPYCWVSRTLGNIINEKAHWIVSREQTYERDFCILAFDLTNETFNEVSLPQDIVAMVLRDDIYYDVFIAGIEQNLSIYCQKRRKKYDIYVEVCMMMKYGVSESWSRMYKFDVGRALLWDIMMCCNLSMSTRKEGRSFFLLLDFGDLLLKDLNSKQIQNVEVFGTNNPVSSIRRHVDSLVSPFLL